MSTFNPNQIPIIALLHLLKDYKFENTGISDEFGYTAWISKNNDVDVIQIPDVEHVSKFTFMLIAIDQLRLREEEIDYWIGENIAGYFREG